MTLKDIMETKFYGITHAHTKTDNMKTVYPPTNTVWGGGGVHVPFKQYNVLEEQSDLSLHCLIYLHHFDKIP